MNTTELMAKIATAIESTTCVFPDEEFGDLWQLFDVMNIGE